MSTTFKIADQVRWNFVPGQVCSRSAARSSTCTRGTPTYNGCIHDASVEVPQYESKSDKTEYVAIHKGNATSCIQ
jgi:hypothetical protein